jgi:hypothetical protein
MGECISFINLTFSGISWALIYRSQRYQSLVEKYHALRLRQRYLKKFIDAEYANQSCPEKYEFKSNADALRHLKK